jgi:thioredoxin 1
MSLVKEINEKSFLSAISKGIVLVDFSAEWCGPCKMLAPILEQLANEMGESITVVKIDVDNAQNIAAQYDITSVPTLILFVDGIEKDRSVGVKDLQHLKKFVKKS